jgi:predicted esterase
MTQSILLDQRIWINIPSAFDFQIHGDISKANEVILLLHGYHESGKRILSKLSQAFPPHAVVLAPNGPFPLPYRRDEKYRIGYSWYFYDPSQQEYYIDMRVPISYLQQGIQQLGLSHYPKRIIGFSQGGYLAPFLMESLGNIQHIIGIGCEYLSDEWPAQFPIPRLDAIHGDRDEVIPLSDAQKTYLQAHKNKVSGEFYILSGVGHEIDEKVQNKVTELLL